MVFMVTRKQFIMSRYTSGSLFAFISAYDLIISSFMFHINSTDSILLAELLWESVYVGCCCCWCCCCCCCCCGCCCAALLLILGLFQMLLVKLVCVWLFDLTLRGGNCLESPREPGLAGVGSIGSFIGMGSLLLASSRFSIAAFRTWHEGAIAIWEPSQFLHLTVLLLQSV